jgi:hypothetical protein
VETAEYVSRASAEHRSDPLHPTREVRAVRLVAVPVFGEYLTGAAAGPALLNIVGCAALTAAKILGEPPPSPGSGRLPPTPGTTAQHRCPSGPPTAPATASAAQETGNSTPHYTASR